ncbi:MAG: MAPEG family protein [Labilithrix sp.]|nr:MAPEG family protein [Labilithrix sp.]MCW5813223.1 MAPEG family protein [Labilithrix sp.]
MTTDLICLVLNALWGAVLVQVEATGKTRAAGVAWNVGNRDVDPKFPDWVGRAGRALANHKEVFPLFLTAVLVVHVTGRADRVSALAAIVYVVARAAHGLVYVAGITRVRSLAYLVATVACLAILSRLVA